MKWWDGVETGSWLFLSEEKGGRKWLCCSAASLILLVFTPIFDSWFLLKRFMFQTWWRKLHQRRNYRKLIADDIANQFWQKNTLTRYPVLDRKPHQIHLAEYVYAQYVDMCVVIIKESDINLSRRREAMGRRRGSNRNVFTSNSQIF